MISAAGGAGAETHHRRFDVGALASFLLTVTQVRCVRGQSRKG